MYICVMYTCEIYICVIIHLQVRIWWGDESLSLPFGLLFPLRDFNASVSTTFFHEKAL